MPAIDLFVALSTQWRRAGQSGLATGLDYTVIEPTLRLMGWRGTTMERAELFRDLQIMEAEALSMWHG